MNEKVKYDVQDEPIVISKATTDRLLKEDKPVDSMAVYWFYYQTAKWQERKYPVRYTKATNNFVAQGLHISEERVSAASQVLVKLGLISRVETRDSITKRVTGNYIKVHFMWGNSRTPEIRSAGLNSRTPEKPPSGYFGSNTEETNRVNTEETKNIPPPAIERFVERFFAIQKEKYPTLIRSVTKSQIKQSVETINQLVRIEHYTLSQVFKTILFAIDHPFWTKQVLSPVGLRNRSKNGNIKFVNILADMEENVPPTTIESDTTTLDPDAQRLYDFVVSARITVSPQDIILLETAMRKYYDAVPTPGRGPDGKGIYHPTSGGTSEWTKKHMTWEQFIKEWLEFLQGKQSTFSLRSVRDLQIGGLRWNEFIKLIEHRTCYDWTTGKFIG